MKRAFIIALAFMAAIGAQAVAPYHIGKPYFLNISALEYDGHNRNFDIICDRTGRVLVANFEGLLVWDGVSWTMTHTPAVSRVTDLYESEDGRIWFGGCNVLGCIDTDDNVSYIINDADSLYRFGEVRNISPIDDGICFMADDGGYEVRHGEIMHTETSANTRTGDMNSSVSIPDQGLTAVATVKDGVVFFDENGEELYRVNSADGLCSDNVSSLAYDGKGTLWGTTDNGIFRVSVSPVFTHFHQTDGLSGQVNTIAAVSGDLLVGTLQGLYVKHASDRSFIKCEGLDMACWQIVTSDDGRIYAATAQGLYSYDHGLKRITSRHTLSIFPLKDGSVISGEVDGMYRIYPDRREVKLNNISDVLKMTADSAGGIRAVNSYQDSYYAECGSDVFTAFKDTIWSLLPEYVDAEGRYWHSRPDGDGILCEALTPEESAWLKMLDHYSIDAVCISGGVAFFGGNFGLVRADLGKMAAFAPFEPALHFRFLDVDGSSVSCSFVADKSDPDGGTSYSYRLYDDGAWSFWSSDNTLSFGHMQSGKYSLSVRCMDAFGSIATAGPVLFTILPPIYLRWYSICAYLIIAAVLASLFMQLRTRSLKLSEARLQKKVEERTAELAQTNRDLKDAQGKLLRQERDATVGKLTKGLIDRILNPMNYINNFSHLSIGLASDLKEDIEDEKEGMSADNYEDCIDVIGMLNTNLGKIEQHGLSTTRILKAMEEMLKERSDKVELTDMVQICAQDYEMFMNYNAKDIGKYHVQFKWNPPEEPVEAMADRTNISKTIMSILKNSIYAVIKKSQKSSAELPSIELSVEKGEGGHGCVIRVHDNGVGIEETIIDRIFDPFFTTKTTSEASGVGLYLCRQSVQDMGGTIDVESEKDKYTDVIITLPK